jgi:tripartite-type tricarboxylate transporter receptor subunit TctC
MFRRSGHRFADKNMRQWKKTSEGTMNTSARINQAALGLMAALATTAPVQAQDWPTRPLTLVVPFAAGSGTDLVARHLAAPLGERIGQTPVV